jgi:Arc/MetJ-type ribon-helix-helix transcriptional regulator
MDYRVRVDKEMGCWTMTINLPEDLERFLRAEVHRGHFASEEDAIAAAVRLLQRQLSQTTKASQAAAMTSDPVLGAMKDAADEMDEIVADAMRHREQRAWASPNRISSA